MEKNLISVITPCFNSEKFIRATIESVQNQSYSNWEMLIVDDCSTDNSIAIIEEIITKDDRIKLFILPVNSGAAVSRNKAISMANGSYIAFLDSDDLWLHDKLEKQLDFMRANKFYFTYTSYNKINENNISLNESVVCKNKLSYKQMLYSNKIGCLTVIYDVQFFGKIYMPLIRKRQDYALWLVLLKKEKYAYGLNLELSSYRLRDYSISSNKFEMLKWNWKMFREIEKLSFIKSLYFVLANVLIKILNR